MIVETHNPTVFLVGIHKSGVIGGKAFTESRVFQILCQASCSIWETAPAIVIQSGEHILFSCFIAQISTEIPQLMRKLGSLVQFCLGKLHIGGIFAFIHKLTNTLGGSFP